MLILDPSNPIIAAWLRGEQVPAPVQRCGQHRRRMSEEERQRRMVDARRRVAELEGLLRKHAALACGACAGTGTYLGDDDRDGPCDSCGGTGNALPDDVAAVLAKRDDKVARPSASAELRDMAMYISLGADGSVNDTIWHTDTETVVDALLRIADEVEV